MTAPRLGPAQKDILGVLAEGPATTADLGKRLPQWSGQTTRNSLRKLAYSRLARVARGRDPSVRDSRQEWAITDAGRQAHAEATQVMVPLPSYEDVFRAIGRGVDDGEGIAGIAGRIMQLLRGES